jgi:hypothetical protein
MGDSIKPGASPAAIRLFSGPCDSTTPGSLRRGLDGLAPRLIPAALLPDLLVIASELASNAVRAGADWLDAELAVLADHLELRVTDAAPGIPTMGDPSPTDADGRGLRIVEALADAWGFTQLRGSGKTVWARARLP